MEVDRRAPGYMLSEEVEREKMRGKAEKRAWNFKRRLEEGNGGIMTRKCWEELKIRWRIRKIVGIRERNL